MKQQDIVQEMKVKPVIDVMAEIQNRVEFIKQLMLKSQVHHLVLGISGGVDSSTAGRLSQLAVEQLREETGEHYQFIAVRLPYKVQMDEDDAQQALQFIQADKVVTVNIATEVDHIKLAVDEAMEGNDFQTNGHNHEDFVKGNVKARMRMIVQYTIANKVGGLVVGTDHSAEAIMGFYTKHGDGAVDLTPLFGLNKRQVRTLCKELGAPENIYNKPATADLEELDPQALDEVRLGVSYQYIDDFLEGKTVPEQAAETIIKQYQRTIHKRSAIPTPNC